MPQVLLHLPLNCPWRATAATALVRSPLSVPKAAIGAVMLILSIPVTYSSIALLPPEWPPTPVGSGVLYVALRIDMLISEAICSDRYCGIETVRYSPAGWYGFLLTAYAIESCFKFYLVLL
jgi:hypothetical protein